MVIQKFKQSLVGNKQTMSLIILDSILFTNNPSLFSQSINLEITFTSLAPLYSPLQWKVIYVGSASSEQYDQVIQQFQIGPFEQASTMKFEVKCNPPNHNRIPSEQILCKYIFYEGVTALILTVSYKDEQFIRVGYYVHNEFLGDKEVQIDKYPILPIMITGIRRTIIADKPRITNFAIKWQNIKNGSKISNESCNFIRENNVSSLSSLSFDYFDNFIKNIVNGEYQWNEQQNSSRGNNEKASTDSY